MSCSAPSRRDGSQKTTASGQVIGDIQPACRSHRMSRPRGMVSDTLQCGDSATDISWSGGRMIRGAARDTRDVTRSPGGSDAVPTKTWCRVTLIARRGEAPTLLDFFPPKGMRSCSVSPAPRADVPVSEAGSRVPIGQPLMPVATRMQRDDRIASPPHLETGTLQPKRSTHTYLNRRNTPEVIDRKALRRGLIFQNTSAHSGGANLTSGGGQMAQLNDWTVLSRKSGSRSLPKKRTRVSRLPGGTW